MADRDMFWFPFREQDTNVLPSDRFANLGADLELHEDLATTPPVVSGAPTGWARQFSGTDSTLIGEDVGALGALSRQVSICALLDFDLAAQDAQATVGYVCAYGAFDDGHISYALRLEVIDPAQRLGLVRMVWSDAAGASMIEPAGVPVIFPADGYTWIVATRFQEEGAIKVRYSVNGESSVPAISPAADNFDISITTGYFWVGSWNDGGPPQYFFQGEIAELAILSEEVSHEEAAIYWRYMSELSPQSFSAMRGLVHAGVYSKDPDSAIQKELQLEAAMMAYAKGTALHMREYFLPDVSFGSHLERWESLHQISPLTTDSIGERRARVLSHTQNVLGADLVSIKLQLEELFGLDSADIEIIQNDNTYSKSAPALVAEFDNHWFMVDGNGAHAIASAELQLSCGAAKDIRYKGALDERAPLALYPIDNGAAGFWVYGKVSAYSGNENVVAGIAIVDRVSDAALFIGVYSDGTDRLGYVTYADGTLNNGISVLENPWGTITPTYFRVRHNGDGTYDIQYNNTDTGWGTFQASGISGPSSPGWAGFAIVSADNDVSVTTESANFDEFSIYAPNGKQRYNWFAYRDNALAGTWDMAKAQILANRTQLSGSRGYVIDRKTGLLCTTATTLANRDYFGTS